jgi:hypothetical protein
MRTRTHCVGKAAMCLLVVSGCTSIGQAGRAAPLIAKPVSAFSEIGFDGDDNELSIAIEKLLDARGVKARILATPEVRETEGNKEYRYKEVQTRYVLRVRSTAEGSCIPEGSPQMNFSLTVTDYVERNRVLVMRGDHACRDTIVREFEKWLSPPPI